jgi:hypothetical protein
MRKKAVAEQAEGIVSRIDLVMRKLLPSPG